MPEGRDRRATPVTVAAIFARRPASIFHDDSDLVIFGSTLGPGPTRIGLGTPKNRIGRGRGRFLHVSSPAVGNENTPPLGTGSSSRRRRGRGGSTRRSVLPSWYPRTPLRDITAFVTAIERRRARLREDEGQQTANSFPADSEEGSELTPQRKLLNSIDRVEKVVTEELHKLKRMPSAKKAEREKKVRTLMSMR